MKKNSLYRALRCDKFTISLMENTLRTIYNYSTVNNYPNPFNPATEIKYQVQLDSKVSIVIYNLKGEKVRTLFDGYKSVGEHNIKWNGLRFPLSLFKPI